MYQLDLEKAEEPEIKLPISVGSLKKQQNSRKTFTSPLLTIPKPLTVWITTNKASGGVPAELFQILKDNAVKVLHSLCQQIWKTQQWSQDCKRSVSFQSQRRVMPKNVQTTEQLPSFHISAR